MAPSIASVVLKCLREGRGIAAQFFPRAGELCLVVGQPLAGRGGIETGQWMPYEQSELANSWDKLRSNSAALTQALEDDQMV